VVDVDLLKYLVVEVAVHKTLHQVVGVVVLSNQAVVEAVALLKKEDAAVVEFQSFQSQGVEDVELNYHLDVVDVEEDKCRLEGVGVVEEVTESH
jgi:hypothetical protein